MNPMATHTIGVNIFAIFEKEEKGGVWSLHFIWGKKDFKIYLGRKPNSAKTEYHGPVLLTGNKEEVIVSNLQYLDTFEWYDFHSVAGHGLAVEEVCWMLGDKKRYVELPKGFHEVAVELACREFGLERQPRQLAG